MPPVFLRFYFLRRVKFTAVQKIKLHIKKLQAISLCMKMLLFVSILLSSYQVFACGNTKNKPAYLSAKKIDCGTFSSDIVQPKVRLGRSSYHLAFRFMDKSGHCPASDPGCFMPHLNLKAKGNAVCRAFGLGRHLNTSDYGYKKFQRVALLRKTRRGLAPSVVPFDYKYLVIKRIKCLPR